MFFPSNKVSVLVEVNPSRHTTLNVTLTTVTAVQQLVNRVLPSKTGQFAPRR